MLKAEVRIDPRRRLGAIDRNIYGGFIEHLGRRIYGGICEPGSSFADGEGFRRDVRIPPEFHERRALAAPFTSRRPAACGAGGRRR